MIVDSNHLNQQEPVHRHTLSKGTELHEYRIESVLGRPGSFGITYLAMDVNLQKHVAIKEYLPSDFAVREGVCTVHVKSESLRDSFDWGLECFEREAQVLARFNHPNIVRVLRFFKLNETAYLVMEYQEGLSLTEYLQQHGPLIQQDLLGVVLPLIDGLKKIHDAKFLHRDIKPNNIYIRNDKTPVLLDFGSARQALEEKRSLSITMIVSPGYAPLEQYDNVRTEQGPWTDIYALGGVMYYAISGETPPAATRRVNKDPMIPAITVGAGRYSKSILTAIDWALEPSEDKRPRSIDKWQEQLLMDVVSPHTLPHQTSVFSSRQLPERYLASMVLPGLVIILLLIATVVSLYQLSQTTQELAGVRLSLETSQFEQQKALRIARDQQQHSEKLQEELLVERRKSDGLTDSLAQGRKHLSEVEESLRKMQDALDRLRHFEPEAVEKALQGKLPKPQTKYYEVVGVRPDDKLSIREYAGHLYKKIGDILPTGSCVKYLHKLETLKNNQPWVLIEYVDTQRCVRGWVNAMFLKEIANSDCDQQFNTLTTAQPCPDEESDSDQPNH